MSSNKPIKIKLSGKPLSTQHIYGITCKGKYPRRYMKKEGKEAKERYQWEIKKQYNGEILECPIEVKVKLVFNDNRRRDFDNWNKIWADSLEGIVYKDDKQIKKATIELVVKDNPHIELEISKYEEN